MAEAHLYPAGPLCGDRLCVAWLLPDQDVRLGVECQHVVHPPSVEAGRAGLARCAQLLQGLGPMWNPRGRA